ncbi:MAG: FtsX-like permease family protein [Clostridia bacterium]
MILLIILLAFLVVNDMSNAFKFKAHELLVLKSLGAKKIDIAKVFGLFSAFVIVLELVCGLGLGALAIVAVNAILLNLNTLQGIVVLTVDGGAMAIAAAIIVVVSALALTYNTLRYNDKNLRKSFQNTKK